MAEKYTNSTGRCIYCDQPEFGRALGEEHVIPRAFGGDISLLLASCSGCERMTSALETECLRTMFQPMLAYMGIRGRKSGRPPTHIDFVTRIAGVGFKKHRVRKDEHPQFIWVFEHGEPGIWCGRSPTARHGIGMRPFPMHPDGWTNLHKLGGEMALSGLRNDALAQLLTKIGHSYAVAKLGAGGFKPLLKEAVRKKTNLPFSHFVGERMPPQPPTANRHEVELIREANSSGREFWIVRVRLFAFVDGTYTYDVVAGEPLNERG